jgi:hypothetical protein
MRYRWTEYLLKKSPFSEEVILEKHGTYKYDPVEEFAKSIQLGT